MDTMSPWKYGGDMVRTTIAPPADQIALTLSSGSEATKVENVLARSANAMLPGASSIAALADGATAQIVRCDFMAGAGANACMGSPTLTGNPGGMAAASTCDGACQR